MHPLNKAPRSPYPFGYRSFSMSASCRRLYLLDNITKTLFPRTPSSRTRKCLVYLRPFKTAKLVARFFFPILPINGWVSCRCPVPRSHGMFIVKKLQSKDKQFKYSCKPAKKICRTTKMWLPVVKWGGWSWDRCPAPLRYNIQPVQNRDMIVRQRRGGSSIHHRRSLTAPVPAM